MYFQRIDAKNTEGKPKKSVIILYFAFQLSFIVSGYIMNRFTSMANSVQLVEYLIPILEIFVFIILYRGISAPLKSIISPFWITILLSVLIIWSFIFFMYRDPFEIFLPFADLMYMFQILYFPAFVETFNFAAIGVGVGRLFMKKGTAILVSALLFAIFYATYLVNQIPGYPFPYDYYFMLDVFAIGLVYIGLDVITDSIYPSVALMLSLALLGIYTPPFPASLFYTLVPS